MRIVILGDGAMGCLFGARLSEHEDVTIIGRHPQAVAEAENGFVVEEPDGPHAFHPSYRVSVEGLEKADVVILFVKGYANADVLNANKAVIGEHTWLVTFQNGAGHEEVMERFVPKEHVVIGTTQDSAHKLGPGHVVHGSRGRGYIGLPQGETGDLAFLAGMFQRAGFDVEVERDVRAAIWKKLANNTSISITTAVLGCSMEELAANPYAWSIVRKLCRETLGVASKDGYPMDEDAMLGGLFNLCKNAHGGYTSIYSDVQAGRKTEVDSISGYVVKRARELGVAVPCQELMVAAVHALETRT